MVARREFEEETGTAIDPATPTIELGSIVQKGGKIVHAWAVEGDLDPADGALEQFEIEWPPRSGRRERFPEIDRVDWFEPDEARRRIKPTQVPADRPARGGARRVAPARRRLGRAPPARTVTRMSVGFAPEATSEPRSGVTTSSSSRYVAGGGRVP